MMGAWEKIVPALERLSGDTGVYLCNLVTGDMRAYAADKPVVAASVIKIPVMIEVFRQARDGLLDLNEIHRLSDDERLPSCGTLLDLTRLMVIVSDNAATNILIRRVGMENVNRTIRELGCEKTCLRRLLFDGEAAARGIENSITAGEMGLLLEKLYQGEVVSAEASAQMLDILKDQRLNGKLPFFLQVFLNLR